MAAYGAFYPEGLYEQIQATTPQIALYGFAAFWRGACSSTGGTTCAGTLSSTTRERSPAIWEVKTMK